MSENKFLLDDLIKLINNDPAFKKNENEYDHLYYKNITFIRLKKIIEKKFINTFEITNNQELFFKLIQTLHAYDISLAIKTGVNFGLFGVNLLRLGGYEQVNTYIKKLDCGEIFGCLAMTEIGHGSNLKKLETTATWDNNLNGFILHTPNELATKCWIGNAACHATHAIVFAQLYYKEKCLGLHAFIVELRKDGKVLSNIDIQDNGYKKGLNGVDNGMIRFNKLYLPRENLLNKFGYINEMGLYVTHYNNNNQRFGDILSTLSAGRAILAAGANIVSMKSLLISIKYSQLRRQFSANETDILEKQIITYTSHQLNLIPLLAKTIVLVSAIEEMKAEGKKEFLDSKISKKLHAFTSGLKIICGEHAEKCCRISRLACGGHGYDYKNEISKMHNDIDIYQTFEGDNTLLRQEVCKYKLVKLNQIVGKSKYDQYFYSLKMKLSKSINDLLSYFNKYYDLNDPNYILKLLKFKEIFTINELVNKLLYYSKNGFDNFESWNRSLDLVLEVSDSYINRRIFQIYNTKPEFEIMLLIFGLDCLHKDLGWYLMNNLLDKSKAHQLIEMKKYYCRQSVDTIDKILDWLKIDEIFWNIPIFNKLKSKL